MKKFYTDFKGPVAAILFFIILGGIYSLTNIQTGLFPDITFPKIKIIAENGQQPVNKMMVTITVPLENAIKKVQNLHMVRSITSAAAAKYPHSLIGIPISISASSASKLRLIP